MSKETLSHSYFDDMYAKSNDPWGFETRWYERRKYDLTVAALPQRRYRRVLEPGCSIGILTSMLAARCEETVATDIVGAALDQARERVSAAGRHGVTFREWGLGEHWGDLGDFDLVVLSEVGYYLDQRTLRHALDEISSHIDDGGTLLSVHWQHQVRDYPLTGSEVHKAVIATTGFVEIGRYRDPDVEILVMSKTGDPRSIAEREGLVG